MNKTTIFSLTLTLWGHHLFSVALAKDNLTPAPSPKEKGVSETRALINLSTH